MVIKLTQNEFEEQFQEAEEEKLQWDTSDELDTVYRFNAQISQGWQRRVYLREGIWLQIYNNQYRDRLLMESPEQEAHFIRCSFGLSGNEKKNIDFKPNPVTVPLSAGQHYIRSNGLLPHDIDDHSDKPRSLLAIVVSPQILRSFAASSDEELPKNLQHLVRPKSQEIYMRPGNTTPMMATVLQQMWNCPYQGLVKRAYLEGKAIELMALVLDQEITIQQGDVEKGSLKPDQMERIYYAREILLRDLSNPPSLAELAQEVGLNDFMLRQGFRQAFGTTVFAQLQMHRLEIAKQLLAEQGISVTKVAHLVGYLSPSYFSRAFKRKFGIGPKAYQKSCR